jgi:hypothetical protein
MWTRISWHIFCSSAMTCDWSCFCFQRIKATTHASEKAARKISRDQKGFLSISPQAKLQMSEFLRSKWLRLVAASSNSHLHHIAGGRGTLNFCESNSQVYHSEDRTFWVYLHSQLKLSSISFWRSHFLSIPALATETLKYIILKIALSKYTCIQNWNSQVYHSEDRTF